MAALAMGLFGYTPAEAWGLTVRDWKLAMHGYQEREKMRSREGWEQTRKIMWASIAAMGGKIKESDLMTFPWEQETTHTNRITSDEQAEEILQRLMKL